MNKATLFLVVSSLLFPITLCSQPSNLGSLVIVGGGLEHSNKNIFNQLINLAGGTEKASFAIIPSASGTPMQSYVYFRNILISYGIKPSNIYLAPVAVLDDDSTKDVNESEWKNNGNDPKVAERVRQCTAVWFSGGDQARTMKTLVRADGSRTPVLDAVWDVYRSGGVIGGTSAGAAIMSEAMIGGGTSIAALSNGVIEDYTGDDFPEEQGVMVTKGLGFFPHGLVDQHFHARARIGRLTVTLMHEKKVNAPGSIEQQGRDLGFGVDENTALVYSGKQNRMHVAGAAGVTILNTSGARFFYAQKLPVIENISLSYLEEGDCYDFTTGITTPAEGKRSTRGKERYKEPYTSQDGVLSPSQATFRDLITIHLADNKATDTIQNITFVNPTSGFRVTLFKTPSTEGFCTEMPRHDDRYTVTGIRMDITPVHISATPVNNKY